MASDLKGKAVLITGASTGIGAAAARAFARLGSHVVVHYNASRDAAEKVAADVRSLGGEAVLGGGAGAIMYAGAKGFISTATHGWAKEVAGDGIRVNAISPGVITTPFHERYTTAEQLKAMQATIPMNRLGTADECAGTLLYLASDELSGYVTGQVIEVNGGQYMP